MDQKNILIVEDEKSLLNALVISLRKTNNIETATDGLEALAKLKTFVPDLIILDIVMPRLDGLGFLKKIRQEEQFKDTPVLILTNWVDEEKKFAAEKLNVKHYLVKANYDIQEIIKHVNKILSEG